MIKAGILQFQISIYVDRTGNVREARMPGSLQPQSAREWPPGDVAPVARGHERPSPNLTVVARCPAARAAGWCVRVACGARPARLGPVGPARPSRLRVTLQALRAGVSGPVAG